ncbi:MAG: hypothetical protein LBC71_08505 [Oscillospiraceae bacterium]|jgi:hypothetical protein|nr:hypothetical protein [Oscillospiraceae bacterium]
MKNKKLKLSVVIPISAIYVAAAVFVYFSPVITMMGRNVELNGKFFWALFTAATIGVIITTLFFEKVYKPYFILPALGVFSFLLFIWYNIVITWDSAHYLSYLPIINGEVPMDYWDVVRGPTFPLYLWFTTSIFGYNAYAVLIVQYVVYAATLVLYYLIANKVLMLDTNNKKLTTGILIYAFVGLCPLFFGYYHVMLTEHLATFLVAALVYFSIVYYSNSKLSRINWKYRVSLVTIISLFPILYFLKQNYLMFNVGAVLAILFMSIVQKQGLKRITRPVRLLIYSIIVTVISITVWNQILPDASDDNYYMVGRRSERLFIGIFTPQTDFIKYSAANDSDMRVSFYTLDGELIDEYIVEGVTCTSELSLNDALSVFFRNITRQPLSVIRGVTDSYLTSINFYGGDTYLTWSISREPSMIRANENGAIGYAVFSTPSFIHSFFPEMIELAEPFDQVKSAGPIITGYFKVTQKPANFMFTLGFLLLPFVWVTSIVMLILLKDSVSFIISFISSTTSLGYQLLNSVSQSFIDRYNFPVFIIAWIAVLALGFGIYKVIYKRRKKIC